MSRGKERPRVSSRSSQTEHQSYTLRKRIREMDEIFGGREAQRQQT